MFTVNYGNINQTRLRPKRETAQHMFNGTYNSSTNFRSSNSTYPGSRSLITRNCNNLITIQTQTSQENRNEAGTTEKYFVPSVLLSNTMSLTPKIDEVALATKQNQCDMAAITETWLKESIPDVSVNIEGYQLFRKDRKNKEHGGVCLYGINHVQCKILACPYNGDYEVLWALLRPKRLPRGYIYSSIIVGVLYHPPPPPRMQIIMKCFTI